MEQSADGAAHAVDQGRGGVGEADAGLEGCDGHLDSRFHICAVVIAGGQICADALDCGQAEGIGQRLGLSGGVTLEAVAQSVKAGVGSDELGSCHGELRIDDCENGNDALADQVHLDLLLSVSDDGGLCCLGAGACGCGDRAHGSYVDLEGLAHVVSDLAAACCHDCACLHGVDAAAAAQSDHEVTAFCLVHLNSSLDHLVGGLAGDVGEDRVSHALALEHILNLACVAELDHHGVGDQKGLFAKCADGGSCLSQGILTSVDLRGNNKVSCHYKVLLSKRPFRRPSRPVLSRHAGEVICFPRHAIYLNFLSSSG